VLGQAVFRTSRGDARVEAAIDVVVAPSVRNQPPPRQSRRPGALGSPTRQMALVLLPMIEEALAAVLERGPRPGAGRLATKRR